jgi:deazaflavin-dependent oxidoreductase (nitroreductase family)
MEAESAREAEPRLLYLTTTGWRSGRPHRIEIWYAELNGRYYLISELGDRAHWVQNVQRRPEVGFELAGRRFTGRGRVVGPEKRDLIRRVSTLFDARYGWSDGLIVELSPIEEA